MAKYLKSSENIPINEKCDNISLNLSNDILSKINLGGGNNGKNNLCR